MHEPEWSPLGDRIAYEFGDVATVVATIGPNGADRLVVAPEANDIEIYSRSASWSSDGSRIAFSHNTNGHDGREQIYAVSPDGTGLTELTTFDALRTDTEPAWSPDGSHIVFTRFDWIALSPPSNPTIELMDANGAGVDALADGEQPEWQPLVAPRNETPRSVGVTRSGQELVAKPGVWFATPELSFTYQWRHCSGFGPCQDIPGANDPTYVLTEDDVFSTVRVFVTATNDQGESLAWSLATDTVGRRAVGTRATITWTALRGATFCAASEVMTSSAVRTGTTSSTEEAGMIGCRATSEAITLSAAQARIGSWRRSVQRSPRSVTGETTCGRERALTGSMFGTGAATWSTAAAATTSSLRTPMTTHMATAKS